MYNKYGYNPNDFTWDNNIEVMKLCKDNLDNLLSEVFYKKMKPKEIKFLRKIVYEIKEVTVNEGNWKKNRFEKVLIELGEEIILNRNKFFPKKYVRFFKAFLNQVKRYNYFFWEEREPEKDYELVFLEDYYNSIKNLATDPKAMMGKSYYKLFPEEKTEEERKKEEREEKEKAKKRKRIIKLI